MEAIISSNMDPNHAVQPESDEIQNKAKQEQEEQMSRNRDLLAALLEPQARERRGLQFIEVSRIALVSPERSKQIEGILLRMAGNLRSRVTDPELIELLDKLEGVKGKARSEEPTIVYLRRKGIDDDFDF